MPIKQKIVKKIQCPFCSEKIVSDAKKCRFCKGNLNKIEKSAVNKSGFLTKKITPQKPYKIWFLSMLFFLISLTQLGADIDSYWFVVMLGSVAVGFIAFIALSASILSSKGKYGIITLLTFFIFFGLLFNYETIANAFGLKSQSKNTAAPSSNFVNTTISPPPTSTLLLSKKSTQIKDANSIKDNQIECIGPDGKQFETSMKECKNINEKWGKSVDYMLNCTYPAECGGGVKYIKKSECDKPCTRVANNANSVNNNQANPTNYPPCTVYYPSLNRSETYNYTPPSDCQKWKDSAAAGSTQIVPTTIYTAPPGVTATPYPTPAVDQAAIDARISRCQGDCIDTVDSYITSVRNSCRASGGWSSYCDDVINSRSAQITSCQSQCYQF